MTKDFSFPYFHIFSIVYHGDRLQNQRCPSVFSFSPLRSYSTKRIFRHGSHSHSLSNLGLPQLRWKSWQRPLLRPGRDKMVWPMANHCQSTRAVRTIVAVVRTSCLPRKSTPWRWASSRNGFLTSPACFHWKPSLWRTGLIGSPLSIRHPGNNLTPEYSQPSEAQPK